MSVLVEFSMSPLDKGESVGPYVARCLDVIDRSGLPYHLHSMGTVLEGTWDECFDVVRQCYAALAEDCSRVTCSIKVDAREGAEGRLDTKAASVEKRIGRPLRR